MLSITAVTAVEHCVAASRLTTRMCCWKRFHTRFKPFSSTDTIRVRLKSSNLKPTSALFARCQRLPIIHTSFAKRGADGRKGFSFKPHQFPTHSFHASSCVLNIDACAIASWKIVGYSCINQWSDRIMIECHSDVIINDEMFISVGEKRHPFNIITHILFAHCYIEHVRRVVAVAYKLRTWRFQRHPTVIVSNCAFIWFIFKRFISTAALYGVPYGLWATKMLHWTTRRSVVVYKSAGSALFWWEWHVRFAVKLPECRSKVSIETHHRIRTRLTNTTRHRYVMCLYIANGLLYTR